jgi:hypothetical protein
MSNIVRFKFKLKGTKVPNNMGGECGRFAENLLKSLGIPLTNSKGIDCKIYGFELKTRYTNATSPQTVASMSKDEWKITTYDNSIVKEKFQKQYRVHIDPVFKKDLSTGKDIQVGGIIIDDDFYDFSPDHIQSLVKEAYDNCREQIIAGSKNLFIYGSYWGFADRKPDSDCYNFRINDAAYKKLEAMSRSTYTTLFEQS